LSDEISREEYHERIKECLLIFRQEKVEENKKLGYLEDTGHIIVSDRPFDYSGETETLIISDYRYKYDEYEDKDLLWKLEYVFLQNIHAVFCLMLDFSCSSLDMDILESIGRLCRQNFIKFILFLDKEDYKKEMLDKCDMIAVRTGSAFILYPGRCI